MSPVHIRRAAELDAAQIAAIHIQAWQWAYRGQIPDAYLDRLTQTIDQRVAWWKAKLAEPVCEERTWVAESAGRVVGFAATGPSRDSDAAAGTGEVYAIYLDPDVVGTGVGRGLFAQAVEDLRQRGYRAATLWVLEGNARARRFYELAGWHPDGTVKTEPMLDAELREVRYRISFC